MPTLAHSTGPNPRVVRWLNEITRFFRSCRDSSKHDRPGDAQLTICWAPSVGEVRLVDAGFDIMSQALDSCKSHNCDDSSECQLCGFALQQLNSVLQIRNAPWQAHLASRCLTGMWCLLRTAGVCLIDYLILPELLEPVGRMKLAQIQCVVERHWQSEQDSTPRSDVPCAGADARASSAVVSDAQSTPYAQHLENNRYWTVKGTVWIDQWIVHNSWKVRATQLQSCQQELELSNQPAYLISLSNKPI